MKSTKKLGLYINTFLDWLLTTAPFYTWDRLNIWGTAWLFPNSLIYSICISRETFRRLRLFLTLSLSPELTSLIYPNFSFICSATFHGMVSLIAVSVSFRPVPLGGGRLRLEVSVAHGTGTCSGSDGNDRSLWEVFRISFIVFPSKEHQHQLSQTWKAHVVHTHTHTHTWANSETYSVITASHSVERLSAMRHANAIRKASGAGGMLGTNITAMHVPRYQRQSHAVQCVFRRSTLTPSRDESAIN